MLTDHGTLTVGGCVPLAAASAATIAGMIACGQKVGVEFQATLDLSLGSLQAKLEAALALQAALTLNPPTLAGQIDAALKLIAALQASLALGLPTVSIQLAAVAELIVGIEGDIAKLNASLAIAGECGIVVAAAIAFAGALGAVLVTPGVKAFSYRGQESQLTSELAPALASQGGQCVAWVFIAADGSAAEASARTMFVGAP